MAEEKVSKGAYLAAAACYVLALSRALPDVEQAAEFLQRSAEILSRIA